MKKLKSLNLLTFLVVFILAFVLSYSCLNCINRFFAIAINRIYLYSTGFSVLVSILVTLWVNITSRHLKNTKLSFWLDMNYPKLLIGHIFLVITFTSIRNTPIWAKEEIENVLSIQWTIFGLSLTIFLVWNVIIVEFLRKAQPKDYNAADSVQQYKYLQQKILFSQSIQTTFSSVVLLASNLFLLILSTALVYIACVPTEIVAQNIVMCSFYFTTNAIAALFTDILRPLNKDKKDLLNENIVTKDELDQAKAKVFLQAIIDGIKNAIMDSDEYTDDEKKEIFVSFLSALRETASKKDDLKAENGSEDTPSMEDQSHVETTEL